MKTLDEVISQLESYPVSSSTLPMSVMIVQKDDIDDALHYLKEYKDDKDELDSTRLAYLDILTDYVALKNFWAESQANPPLTWNELKSMEEKPVWVECKFYSHQWAIIGEVTENRIRFYGPRLVDGEPQEEMGEIWQAYRKERS